MSRTISNDLVRQKDGVHSQRRLEMERSGPQWKNDRPENIPTDADSI
jgi:hypothetical protein